MLKYLAVLFLFLSACNRNHQDKHEVFYADIVENEGGEIDLKSLRNALETNQRIGVIRSGSHGDLSVLHEACSSGQIDAVKLMLAHKEKLDLNAGDFAGLCEGTALGRAVMNGHYDIAELLLKSGADPNGPCGHDNTISVSLAMALYHDDQRMVALLRKYGADINAKDINGRTEFMRCDSGEDLEKLIQGGADIHATDSSGYSKFFELPSIHQVGADEIEKIVKILKKAGLNINKVHNGQTPLSKLIDENNLETARILVRNGARFPQNYEHHRYLLQSADPAKITAAEIEREHYQDDV